MMSFDQFISAWNGKYRDFDGQYGFQCMDLMHFYIVEVLGGAGSLLAAPYAINVWDQFSTLPGAAAAFDQVPNSPTGIPPKGSIIFWGAPYGKFINNLGQVQYAGHVGVGTNSDISIIRAFEQNNPSGSACHVQEHLDNYNGCKGWLVFKQPAIDWQGKYNDLAGKMRTVRDISNGAGV